MGLYRLLPTAGASLAVMVFAAPLPAQNPSPKQEAAPPAMDVARLFATSCGWCHQGGGRVQGRGPKLAGTDKPDDVIISQIKNGKPPGMPAFGKNFSDEQIKAIVAYIRGLKDTP